MGTRRLDEGRQVGAALRSLRHLGARSDRREAGRRSSPIRSAARTTSSSASPTAAAVAAVVAAAVARRPGGGGGDDRGVIDPAEPLMLRAVNTETMASGFYRDQLGVKKEPEKIVMSDLAYGTPIKAANADVYMIDEEHVHRLPESLGRSVAHEPHARSPTRTRSRRTTTGAPRSSCTGRAPTASRSRAFSTSPRTSIRTRSIR